MVNNKKTKQWFNENCKKAMLERDKAKFLVVIESCEEKKKKTSPETKRN